jgi:hypothetical protein
MAPPGPPGTNNRRTRFAKTPPEQVGGFGIYGKIFVLLFNVLPLCLPWNDRHLGEQRLLRIRVLNDSFGSNRNDDASDSEERAQRGKTQTHETEDVS